MELKRNKRGSSGQCWLIVGLGIFISVGVVEGSTGLAAISRRGDPPKITQPFTPHHISSGKSWTSSTTSKTVEDEDYDDYEDELDDLLDYEDTKKKSSKHGSGAELSRGNWREEPCPLELHGHCHCGILKDVHNTNKFEKVVNCTNAGFTDANFLQFIPDDTQRLVVRNNKIRELPTNLLGRNRSHLSLREIDLSNNEIEIIYGKSFHHVPNVDTLILNFNKINDDSLAHSRIFSNFHSLKYLHLTRAFQPNHWLMDNLLEVFRDSNLTKLLKLHLEQNEIGRIENGREFCDLAGLMDLHLGQNGLTDLRLDVSDANCLPSLRLIDLSYNKVTSVRNTSGIFQLLNRSLNERGEPLQVDLYENPFHCDCHLNSYLEWLQDIRLHDADRVRHGASLRCQTAYPTTNVNKLLFSLIERRNMSPLPCAPQLRTTNQVINTLSWTIFSLIILTAFILLIALYLHKMGVPNWAHRLLATGLQSPLLMTTTGVKYTSVEKEEAAEVAHV